MGGSRSDFVDLDVNGSLLFTACRQAAGRLNLKSGKARPRGVTFCAMILAEVFTFAWIFTKGGQKMYLGCFVRVS
jgi:hypothetical protein